MTTRTSFIHVYLILGLFAFAARTQTVVRTKPESSGSTVTVSRVPNEEAQRLLEGLIPSGDKHHMATIRVYTPGNTTKRVSLGMSCSSSGSGDVNEDGHITTSGSSSCAERHANINDVWLGLEDHEHPNSAYLITARCLERTAWNHCEVPPPGSYYDVVLQQEKHGNFKVYIGIQPKIGGKVKVSTWDVLYVEYVAPKS